METENSYYQHGELVQKANTALSSEDKLSPWPFPSWLLAIKSVQWALKEQVVDLQIRFIHSDILDWHTDGGKHVSHEHPIQPVNESTNRKRNYFIIQQNGVIRHAVSTVSRSTNNNN